MGHDFHLFSSTVRLLSSNRSRSDTRIRYSFPILMAGSFFLRIQSQTVMSFTLYLSATCWQFRYFSKISPPILYGLYLCFVWFCDIIMLSHKQYTQNQTTHFTKLWHCVCFCLVCPYITTQFQTSQEFCLILFVFVLLTKIG